MSPRGMILAAGLGTRLLPITDTIPKPLVPVLNVPNILHTLELFSRAGIEEVIINLFHLTEEMERFFASNTPPNMRIHFSREKILMGTGGGVKLAEKFFGSNCFVLANCDFVTNVELKPFIEKHKQNNHLATMLLLSDPSRAKHYSPVGVTTSGAICQLPKYSTAKPSREGIFTGIHILQPETLQHLKEEPCGINDLLYPALMKKVPEGVHGAFMNGAYWCDTGDIPTLLETSKFLLHKLTDGEDSLVRLFKKRGIDPILLDPPSLVGRNVQMDSSAKIEEGVVLGDRCKIESGVTLQNCIILEGSTVPKNTIVKNAIFYKGKIISAKSPA